MDDLVAGELELEYRREHPLAADEWLASRVLECIASPRAVCRLALVNKNFSAASTSDLVWQRLLPPAAILNPLLAHVNYQPLSKKHLFIYLCKSITYDQGLKKFWLDPSTGGECHMISSKALSIIWGDTPQYWQWKPYPGSMFSEVACLRAVCWFEVSGNFQYHFRPGRYMISFRLQLHSNQGWQGVPVKLCIQNTTYAHPPHESEVRFEGPSFKIRSCPISSMFATSPEPATSDNEGLVNPCSGTSSKRGGERRGKKKDEIGDIMHGKTREEISLEMQHTRVDFLEGQQGQLSRFFKRLRTFVSGVEPIKSELGSYSGAHDDDKNKEARLCVNPIKPPTKTNKENVNRARASSNKDPHIWVECDVGEFFVEDDNENRPIEVKFSMKEVEVGWWKGGLFLDGVIIRPSYVIDNIVNDMPM